MHLLNKIIKGYLLTFRSSLKGTLQNYVSRCQSKLLNSSHLHPQFTTRRPSSPSISLWRSDPGNTSKIYLCFTMTFSNFNDLNCEKNILNIPHFYHILSILDKLLSCELHYNVGCFTPPHITSHENCCHPLLCNSPFFLFQKTV